LINFHLLNQVKGVPINAFGNLISMIMAHIRACDKPSPAPEKP
jgi:hypothetical protein